MRRDEANVRPRTRWPPDPDPPAMEFNELAAEGESEAGALHLLHRRPHLPKLFEHRLLILRRDAHPGIAHRNLRRLVLPRGANLDSSPFWRELQSVREEVQEHLLDLPLVGPNPAEPLVYRFVKCNPASRRPLPAQRQRIIH